MIIFSNRKESYPVKLLSRVFLVVSILLGVVGCSSDDSLAKAGKGRLAQSEFYVVNKQIGDAIYYQPVDFNKAISALPAHMKENLKLIDSAKLPFPVGQETAYLATFRVEQEEEDRYQVQFTYLPKKEGGWMNGDDFFIIRMTDIGDELPAGFEARESGLDMFGNKIDVEHTENGVRLHHHIHQTNSGYVYTYYSWDAKENYLATVVTTANEINFCHNGIWYQIGYHINGNQVDESVQKQMAELAKELIEE